MALLFRLEDDSSGYSIVIEEDERVAYAYLLNENDVVADVWLYNSIEAPTEPEWSDSRKLPFCNPKAFSADDGLQPIRAPDEIDVCWKKKHGELEAVELSLRGAILAILKPGIAPGWCRNAIVDGPLANVLKTEE